MTNTLISKLKPIQLPKLNINLLSYLSILVICGLMFFPLEGDCEWTYVDEGYSYFSDSAYESHGGGWTLTGSVSANSSGASATMGPSIKDETLFDGPYGKRVGDYAGHANVEASREEVAIWYSSTWSHSFYSQRVTFEAKVDDGDGDLLHAWVSMVEKITQDITAVEKADPEITIALTVPTTDARAQVGAEWKKGGKTYRTQTSVTIKEIIPKPYSKSVNAYVSGLPEASKSAAAYGITFAGNSYGSADASYATWGE